MFKLAIVIVAVATLYTSPASACRCVQPQLLSTYFNPYYSRIVAAKLLYVTEADDGFAYFAFRVKKVYKGCELNYFIAKSSLSSASCGITLTPKKTYIVPLPNDLGVPHLTTCQFIRETSALTIDERKFLYKRNVCCGKSCECSNGQPPVNCFVAPCSVTTCPVGTNCVDNYCGGCNADCVPI